MFKPFALSILVAGLAIGYSADSVKVAAPKTAPAKKKGAASKVDLVLGKKVFETYCVACHGALGKGDGAAAAALTPKPRDFSDSAYMQKRPKDKLRKVISEGGPSEGFSPIMAGWKGTLKEPEIDAVLGFVLTLSKPAK